MTRYVKYLRVSTREQGRSGLGLEGQERDITHYLETPQGFPLRSRRDIRGGSLRV